VKRGTLLLVAGLIAVGGCGGGDDASSSSTTAGASGAGGAQGPTSAAVDVSFAKPTGSQANATGAYLLKANRIPTTGWARPLGRSTRSSSPTSSPMR
jgi:hypothetical protein